MWISAELSAKPDQMSAKPEQIEYCADCSLCMACIGINAFNRLSILSEHPVRKAPSTCGGGMTPPGSPNLRALEWDSQRLDSYEGPGEG